MSDLLRFNFQAFDLSATIKVALGMMVMMVLTESTGETWLATGLVVLFAWFTNVPGPLKCRVGGMLVFAVGAALLTVLFGLIELAIWPNTALIAVMGFLGTVVLARGMRAFMVGWALICWAIYGPFLVAATSVVNCLLAIAAGVGVLILLNVIGDKIEQRRTASSESIVEPDSGPSSTDPPVEYIIGYAVTVAIVLAVTTYFGWVELKTDPTLMAGGAFFIIGFDARKTVIAGFGRLMGLVGGTLIGLAIASLVDPGMLLTAIMVAACGLSFGAAGIHSGAWMFFFMIFVAIGWPELDPEAFNLAAGERFYGETMGILAAMAALVFLQWLQRYQSEG